jgi:hypothetical protein
MAKTKQSNLNLDLRIEVLSNALSLEDSVNSILLIYLAIDKKERKAISNKSGNLSFKNKIDLLFDLDILNKDEYDCFLLLMEYRNQFMHNIDCISFSYASSILGPDKKKRLLKFNQLPAGMDMESQLKNSFFNLYGKTLEISLKKIEERKEIIEENKNMLTSQSNYFIYVLDNIFVAINTMFDKFDASTSDQIEVLKLKIRFFEALTNELKKISDSEEYKTLRTQLENETTPDRLGKYIKLLLQKS